MHSITESGFPILMTGDITTFTGKQGLVVIQNNEGSLSGSGNVLCCAVFAFMERQ